MSLKSKIESLLFVANKPITTKELATFLEAKPREIELELENLMKDYLESQSGLQVIENNSKFQLVSSAENSRVVSDFIKDETSGELSRPSLETLTIIAYRGPITKIDLDRIRGVNCALILRNLLIRGLIEERFDKDKNETYYTVTLDFIRFLGINKVEDLPDFSKLSQDDSINKMLDAAQQEEGQADSELREVVKNEQIEENDNDVKNEIEELANDKGAEETEEELDDDEETEDEEAEEAEEDEEDEDEEDSENN